MTAGIDCNYGPAVIDRRYSKSNCTTTRGSRRLSNPMWDTTLASFFTSAGRGAAPGDTPWGSVNSAFHGTAGTESSRAILIQEIIMANRREFIKGVLGGTASITVSGLVSSRQILGANDRIRIGLIGAGGRGKYDFKKAIACPNVEPVAVADVYTRHLDEVKALVPSIQTYQDYRRLLDDKSIDAVIIVTPPHQHALNFVPAIQAGKDVYQEKTMAFNPKHARRMRRAYEGSGRVVQIGMQMQSGPGYQMVQELATPETHGNGHDDRDAPLPQFALRRLDSQSGSLRLRRAAH